MDEVGVQGKEILSCEPCKYDNPFSLPAGYCLICGEFLCQPCIQAHRKNKASRNHKILENGDMPTNLQTRQMLKESLFCITHVDKELCYKCKDHDVYICDVCFGKDHRRCFRVTDLATLEDTEDDNALMNSLLSLRENNRVLKIKKDKHLFDIEREKKMIEKERRQVKQNLTIKLQSLQREQIEKTESLVNSILTAIVDSYSEYESHETDITALLEVLLISKNTKSTAAIYIVSEKIQSYIHSSKRLLKQSGKNENVMLSFVPSISISDISSLGVVKKTIQHSDDVDHTLDCDKIMESFKQVKHDDVNRLMKNVTEKKYMQERESKNGDIVENKGIQRKAQKQGEHVMLNKDIQRKKSIESKSIQGKETKENDRVDINKDIQRKVSKEEKDVMLNKDIQKKKCLESKSKQSRKSKEEGGVVKNNDMQRNVSKEEDNVMLKNDISLKSKNMLSKESKEAKGVVGNEDMQRRESREEGNTMLNKRCAFIKSKDMQRKESIMESYGNQGMESKEEEELFLFIAVFILFTITVYYIVLFS